MEKEGNTNTRVNLGILEIGQPYEIPYTEDIENSPVVLIAGGTGVGKTYLARGIAESLIKLNTPEGVHIHILDSNDTRVWRNLAKEPHVKGHHKDLLTYNDVLAEVKEECNKRQKELDEKGLATRKEYVDKYGEASMPLKVVIVDEIYGVMSKLGKYSEGELNKFKEILVQLSKEIQSTGIVLMALTYGAKEHAVPSEYVANATLKVGMKMLDSSHEILFGKGLEEKGIEKPTNRGDFIVTTSEYPTPTFVKGKWRG